MAMNFEQLLDDYMQILDNAGVWDDVPEDDVDDLKESVRDANRYLFRAIVEHIQNNAELDGTAESGIAVEVDPNTGEGATTETGNVTGGVS